MSKDIQKVILESVERQKELLKACDDTTKIGIKWFMNYVRELLNQPYCVTCYLPDKSVITNTDIGYIWDFIQDFKKFLTKEGIFKEGEEIWKEH